VIVYPLLFLLIINLPFLAPGIALIVASTRATTRLRCRSCDYLLVRLKRSTGPCPECGTEFDLDDDEQISESERPRRRRQQRLGWALITVAVVLDAICITAGVLFFVV